MAIQISKQYQFGCFVLNPQARELRQDGHLVTLAPKVLDALLWLFEHRERAVGRDELAATVWGRADVTDAQLDQIIRQMRKVLGDSGSAQEFIRTVPRFGYRWVAEVELLAAVPVPAPVAEPTASDAEETLAIPPASSTSKHGRRARLLIALPLIALLMAALAWFGRGFWLAEPTLSASSAAATRTAPLIAVLPVAMDADADSRHAWLRLGLMDLIAARLVDGGVQVVPAHNILALMASGPAAQTAERVRASTGASVILKPTIERAEDGWRLRLELDGLERAARQIEIFTPEPTQSAREAADRVLVMMGRPPVIGRLEVDPEEDETGLRLNAAVASRRYDIARQVLDDAPPARRGSPLVRFMSAHVLLHEGRSDEALQILETLADAPAAAGIDAALRSKAQSGAGAILAQSGRFAEGLVRLDEAVRIAAALRLTESYAGALLNRAAIHAQLGQWPAADADFARARVALDMIGDSLGLAELTSNQVGTLINRQHFSEAATLQAQAIERLEQFAPGEFLLSAYRNQIALKLDLLEVPEALAVATQAEETLTQRMPDWPTDLALQFQMVRADLAAGRFAAATQRLDANRTAAALAPSPWQAAATSQLRAHVAFASGRTSEARELASQASALYATPDLAAEMYVRGRSSADLLLVKAALAEGQVDQAASVLTGFDNWARERADPVVAVQLALARALVAASHDTPLQARRLFDAALETALPTGPATVAQVAIAYSHYLIQHEDLDAAARVVGRIAPWARSDYGCAMAQLELYHALGQVDAWRRSIKESRSLAGERTIPPALEREPLRPPPNRVIAERPGAVPST